MIRAGRFYAVVVHTRDRFGRPRVGYRVHDDVAGVVRTVHLPHGSVRAAKRDASAEVAKLYHSLCAASTSASASASKETP